MWLVFFFQNIQNLMEISEMQNKKKKIISLSEITAFELVAVTTNFYRERKLLTGSQYGNKQSEDLRYT